MSPALIKQGKVLNSLLSACLIDKSIDPDELLSGDRNALMIAIRITGYGSDYTVQTTCPNCSARRPQTYDLAELEIKRLILNPVDESGSVFEFDLPVTKKKVYFKFLNGKEEADRNLFIERMKNYPNLIKNLKLDLLDLDATRIPYPDNYFNYVVALSILSLLGTENRVRILLSELKRVMAPKGKIIIDINDQDSEFSSGKKQIDKNVFVTKIHCKSYRSS